MSRRYSTRQDYPRREPEGIHSAPRRTAGAPKKTNIISSQDSYAACYFRDHPDVKIDTTDPKSKLEEFENSLENYELDDNQKFQLLIRSKAMIYLIYGEDSPEAFKIHSKLGAFYNETHRPQSALRHLQKAHEIAGRENIDKKDLILVAVDTAEAHLALRDDNRQESQKHIQQANECIKQIQNYETDDLDLRYRCELVYARVISAGKHPEKSFKQYEQAMQTLREKLNGEPDTQLAKLYIEMCEVAQKIGDNDRKVMYAEQAYKTFLSLEMYASAEECAKKYPGPYSQSQATPSDMGYYDDAYLYGTPAYPTTYGSDDQQQQQQQQHQEYGDSAYYASTTTNENDQNYGNSYNYEQPELQAQQEQQYNEQDQQQPHYDDYNETQPQENENHQEEPQNYENYNPEQTQDQNDIQERNLPTEEQNSQHEEYQPAPPQEEPHNVESDHQPEINEQNASDHSDHPQEENEQQQQSDHSDNPQEEAHTSDHEENTKAESDHPQEETHVSEHSSNHEEHESDHQQPQENENVEQEQNNESQHGEEQQNVEESQHENENKESSDKPESVHGDENNEAAPEENNAGSETPKEPEAPAAE